MKLVTALVYLCITGGNCMNYNIEIEPRACKYGSFHGKYLGMDVTLGVRCKP